MSEIKIRCLDQALTITNSPVIASGGTQEDRMTFDFCSQWDGFTKTAIFYQDKANVYYSLLDTDDSCVIPKEATANKGTMYFGVFGVKDSVTRTSEILRYKIVEGAITEDITPGSETPELWEQVLSKVNTKVGYAEKVSSTLYLYSDNTKTNLIASIALPGGGSGGGVTEEEVREIIESYGFITLSALSVYYTKTQVDSLVNDKANLIQLYSDGNEIYEDETEEKVLTYAEIKALISDDTNLVTLWNGNYVLRPEYTYSKSGEEAIWFNGVTTLAGKPYIYRIIINSNNVVSNDEYELSLNADLSVYAKTTDLANYQTSTDENLPTMNKTIVGAITSVFNYRGATMSLDNNTLYLYGGSYSDGTKIILSQVSLSSYDGRLKVLEDDYASALELI